jgi:protein-S-isoprenylcysteine O-methyltransferase Ste14
MKLTKYDAIGLCTASALTIYNIYEFSKTQSFLDVAKGLFSFMWVVIIFVRLPATSWDASAKAILISTLHFALPTFYGVQGHTLSKPLGWTLLVTGNLLAGLALLALNTSFAILPAMRKLKTKGPYAVVRHPIYLGYVLLTLGSTLLLSSVHNWLWWLAFLFVTHLRIQIEEEFQLLHSPNFPSYRDAVKFKLLPGLY